MKEDPSFWAALLAWLSLHQPQIYAGLTAGLTALVRVIYGGGGRRQMMLEGALCGLIAVSLVPVLEYLRLPSNLATFAGCMVGFMGVEKIRDYADRWLGRKADQA
ncbi:phage holin, lambda family [Pseudomonas citronellolis]|uniref:phage holin, lambda family n=1 Tax=Pseudomonas citronellolis TaxID=53408 RepID=UPI002D796C45|nr:phage holin, lambda family [Pseudomonas citronellolis]WRT83485.1 phage holin, lambda family [Pseudomonas citronellolis]